MPAQHRLAMRPAPSPSDAVPAFYRLRDVVRITALSRSTVYRRIAEGRFPAPIHLGDAPPLGSAAPCRTG